jgi:hypothetical protein
MPLRWPWFLGIGAVSGLLSAIVIVFYHMGDVAAPEVAGYCFGLRMYSRCDGVDATLYLFPGSIFGVLFAALQVRRGWNDPGRVIAFVVVSGVANAVAVLLCVWLTGLLADLLDSSSLNLPTAIAGVVSFLNLPTAIAGAIAGAAGGALLGGVAATLFPGLQPRRSIIVAAALGLLVPLVLVWEIVGVFIFYPIWQGGYAVALAMSRPPQR